MTDRFLDLGLKPTQYACGMFIFSRLLLTKNRDFHPIRTNQASYALKKLKLRYHNPETTLFTNFTVIYYYLLLFAAVLFDSSRDMLKLPDVAQRPGCHEAQQTPLVVASQGVEAIR